jgi:hypothetical protein
MNLFFIPFFYFFASRLKSAGKTVSWVAIYFIPLILVIYPSYEGEAFYFFTCFSLITLNLYNLYEIGYIYNDNETIKKEVNPTLRLTINELSFYSRYRVYIYGFRFILSFFVIYILSSYYEKTINTNVLIFVSAMLVCTFFIYNSVRGLINLPLHFILVILRFSSVVLCFSNVNNSVLIFFMSFILFPLPNLIDRSGEGRFGLGFFQRKFFINRDRFRVIYYFICSLFILFFSSLFAIENEYIYIAFLYMLSIRSVMFLLSNRLRLL